MGRPKATLPFDHETLLDRVIRLVAPHVDDVVLAAGPGQRVPAGWHVVRDASEGLGPVPALVGALSHVRHATAFVVACDTPLLQPAIIATLAECAEGWDACVPVVGEVEMTTCAVYRTDAVLAAARRGGGLLPTSLRGLIAQLRVRAVHADELRALDPGLVSFTPCNTPEEYQHALELAGLAP
jgi:molybdopterin-guanine dinucleotide biosynthesis protein A